MIHHIFSLRIITLVLVALLYACGGGGGDNDDQTDDSDVDDQLIDGDSDDDDDDNSPNTSDIDDDNDGLIEIATLEELDWMRNDLTGASLTDHNANVMMDGCPNTGCIGYELITDLDFDTNADGVMDANDTYFNYDGDGQNNGWLPIGIEAAPFLTTFEGNNHRVSNLYIMRDAADTQTSGNDIGLLGAIDGGVQTDSEIRNLILDGNLMQVTGDSNTGGLVGQAINATINNSYVSGNVTGKNRNTGGLMGLSQTSTTINNSYATGVVTGSDGTGGLVGQARTSSTINNSYATGNVTGSNSFTGGFVGVSSATINNSYATGDVTGISSAGGLVGQASATINDSYATGNVTSNSDTGGLVGWALNSTAINNSYATGNVTGNVSSSALYTGGLVGRAQNSITINNSNATGSVTGFSNTGGLVGLAQDSITISNSYATGPIIGNNFTGGLVGSVNFDSPTIFTTISTISNSFATGAVSTSGNNNYVGGLIGISYHLNLDDSFATGAVTNANRYVGGLIGDANAGSAISRSFSSNTVTANLDVGALIGYSDSATYTDNYFANDLGIADALGTNVSAGGINPAGTNGDTLTNLQAVTAAGPSGFTTWGAVWDFGTNTQLPGLIIDGVTYRDGDANGVLD